MNLKQRHFSTNQPCFVRQHEQPPGIVLFRATFNDLSSQTVPIRVVTSVVLSMITRACSVSGKIQESVDSDRVISLECIVNSSRVPSVMWERICGSFWLLREECWDSNAGWGKDSWDDGEICLLVEERLFRIFSAEIYQKDNNNTTSSFPFDFCLHNFIVFEYFTFCSHWFPSNPCAKMKDFNCPVITDIPAILKGEQCYDVSLLQLLLLWKSGLKGRHRANRNRRGAYKLIQGKERRAIQIVKVNSDFYERTRRMNASFIGTDSGRWMGVSHGCRYLSVIPAAELKWPVNFLVTFFSLPRLLRFPSCIFITARRRYPVCFDINEMLCHDHFWLAKWTKLTLRDLREEFFGFVKKWKCFARFLGFVNNFWITVLPEKDKIKRNDVSVSEGKIVCLYYFLFVESCKLQESNSKFSAQDLEVKMVFLCKSVRTFKTRPYFYAQLQHFPSQEKKMESPNH